MEKGLTPRQREAIKRRVVSLLAGLAAEILNPDFNDSEPALDLTVDRAANDFKSAFKLTRLLGMDEAAARLFLEQCAKPAEALVMAHREAIRAVAERLLEARTLSAKQVREIMKRAER